ncbi:MAG: hypothetical protein J6T43_07860 [Prevotella sp.]|nr:hypothetical protein [Prevotella sp.]
MNKILLFLLVSVFVSLRCVSQSKGDYSFVVSTWNIGHFANGKKNHSLINSSQYQSKLKGLHDILTDSIGADIMCLNEYSHVLGTDQNKKKRLSKKVLLNKFKIKKEGRLAGFSCNSIFSNLKVKNVKECPFNSSKSYLAETPRAANYYYLCGDLYVNGVVVKLVCAHTTSSAIRICRAQINELIKKFEGYDRVIMCGDWNTTNYSQFKIAGYSMANDGSIITYPKKSYALDNIVVKGLEISDVRVVKTDLSDHYPLVCRVSFKK